MLALNIAARRSFAVPVSQRRRPWNGETGSAPTRIKAPEAGLTGVLRQSATHCRPVFAF